MQFRKGDIVSITAAVEYDFNGADHNDALLFLKVPGNYQSLGLTRDHFDRTNLKLVQPIFEVGDDVSWPAEATQTGGGVILSISNGHAWIELGGGDYCTRMLTSLTRNEVVPDEA